MDIGVSQKTSPGRPVVNDLLVSVSWWLCLRPLPAILVWLLPCQAAQRRFLMMTDPAIWPEG